MLPHCLILVSSRPAVSSEALSLAPVITHLFHHLSLLEHQLSWSLRLWAPSVGWFLWLFPLSFYSYFLSLSFSFTFLASRTSSIFGPKLSILYITRSNQLWSSWWALLQLTLSTPNIGVRQFYSIIVILGTLTFYILYIFSLVLQWSKKVVSWKNFFRYIHFSQEMFNLIKALNKYLWLNSSSYLGILLLFITSYSAKETSLKSLFVFIYF